MGQNREDKLATTIQMEQMKAKQEFRPGVKTKNTQKSDYPKSKAIGKIQNQTQAVNR